MITTTQINKELLDSTILMQKKQEFEQFQHAQGGGFIKKGSSAYLSFGHGILDYGSLKKVVGFSAAISFPAMEKILQPIMKKNELRGGEWFEITSSFDPPYKEFENKINQKDVRELKDLEGVKEVYFQFFLNDAKPFFEKWGDISKAHKLSQEDDSREFLSGIFGPFWEFKKAILMRLCNDSEYQVFMDSFYNKRKQIYENYPEEDVALKYYKAAQELKNQLDKRNINVISKEDLKVSRLDFFNAGLSYFNGIKEQYGLITIINREYSYGAVKFFNSKCIIDISLDRYYPNLNIYFINPTSDKEFNYGLVMKKKEVFNKEKLDSYNHLSENEQIEHKLKNIAYLMNKYCSDILKGDFSKLEEYNI